MNVSRLVIVLGVLLALIAGVWLFSIYFTPAAYDDVRDLRASGNYEEALRTAEEIENEPGFLPDEKALAKLNVSTIPYTLSGNIEDAIRSIRELKAIAADESLSAETRGTAVFMVASWYQRSGSNMKIFEEIFSDEPYKGFEEKSTNASYRNLLRYGHSVSPSAQSAFLIAASFIKSAFNQDGSSEEGKTTIQRALDRAEQFLAEGRRLQQSSGDGKSTLSSTSNLYWEAYTVGGLAYFGRESYKAEYRSKYEQLIAHLKNAPYDQKALLPSALWRYAHYVMLIGNDEAMVRATLSEAVKAVSSSPNPSSSGLVALIRHLKEMQAAGSRSAGVVNFEKEVAISPEFKAFAESI